MPSPVSSSSQASAQFEIGNDLPAGVIALHGMVYVRLRCLSLSVLLADFGARCLFVFFFCCSARAAPFLSGTADGKTLSPLDGKGQDLTPARSPQLRISKDTTHHLEASSFLLQPARIWKSAYTQTKVLIAVVSFAGKATVQPSRRCEAKMEVVKRTNTASLWSLNR